MILIAVLGLASPAWAHLWYPPKCCTDKDCHPMAVDDVRIDSQGYHFVLDGEPYLITFDRAQMSPDGQFHVCNMGKSLMGQAWVQPCFWAPQGGV